MDLALAAVGLCGQVHMGAGMDQGLSCLQRPHSRSRWGSEYCSTAASLRGPAPVGGWAQCLRDSRANRCQHTHSEGGTKSSANSGVLCKTAQQVEKHNREHWQVTISKRGNSGVSTPEKGETESHTVVSDSLQPHGLYRPWNSPGQNTGVGSLSLLQGIFLTQESIRDLLHRRQILYQLSSKGSPGRCAPAPRPFHCRSESQLRNRCGYP